MIFLVIRCLLSLVFLIAGVTKLLNRDETRRAIIAFGASAVHANWLVYLIVGSELLLAIGLLSTTTAWVAAWGSLLLLLFFTGVILLNLAQGRRPACHCFGELSAAPIGRWTVARNGALAALALLVVVQGPDAVGPSFVNLLAAITPFQSVTIAGFLLLTMLFILQGWFLINLLQQNGQLLRRVDALEASAASALPRKPAVAAVSRLSGKNEKSPPFQLPDLTGELHSLETLQASGKSLLLIFGNPSCGPCTAMMPEIAEWQRKYAAHLQIVLISRGSSEENRAKFNTVDVAPILLQSANEVAEAYGIKGTPSAQLILPNGTQGSAVVEGREAIRSLLSQAIMFANPVVTQPGCRHCNTNGTPDSVSVNGGHANGEPVLQPIHPLPVSPRIGRSAPEVALPDLDGRIVTLASMKGKEVVLLFWNPNCGFCRQMVPDLRAWEADLPADAPELVIISSGSPLENRTYGFKSLLLIDEGFASGRLFHANGTPSALWIDKDGAIASPLAVGAPAVLRLLGFKQLEKDM